MEEMSAARTPPIDCLLMFLLLGSGCYISIWRYLVDVR